jgi:hypothetical protein
MRARPQVALRRCEDGFSAGIHVSWTRSFVPSGDRRPLALPLREQEPVRPRRPRLSGSGGGPSSRNTFYADLGVVGTMWFKKLVTFSARACFNFYSDRHCPEVPDPSELAVEPHPRSLTAPLGSASNFLIGLDRFSTVRVKYLCSEADLAEVLSKS